MVEEHVGRLLKLSKAHQGHLDGLRRDVGNVRKATEGMQEEVEALRECLEASGLLRRGQLAAHLHRRRFDTLLRRSSYSCDVLLTDIVQAPGVLHPILQFAGVASIPRVSACSSTLRGSTEVSQKYAARPTRLYLLGGSSGSHQPLASALRLDVTRGEWEHLPPMPTERDVLAAAAVDGKLYAVGGTDGHRAFSALECYDTEIGMWSELEPMPTARGGLGAAAMGGVLYVIGGSDGERALRSVECYDIGTNRWMQAPALLTPRRGVAAATCGRYLYAIGGSDGSQSLDTVERLDVESGSVWEAVAPMATPRRAAAAAVLNGRVYVAGGAGGVHSQDPSLDLVECLDPERNVWEELPRMPTARRGLVLLPAEGRLWALGGSDSSEASGAVEVFHTETGVWTVLPAMPVRCGYFGAAVIQTFEVLGLTIGPAAAQELRSALSSRPPSAMRF